MICLANFFLIKTCQPFLFLLIVAIFPFWVDPMWTQKAETIKKLFVYLCYKKFTRGVLLPGAPDRAFLNKFKQREQIYHLQL